MNMKIILFLGSGVSFPTGLPCAKKVTDSILSDEWHSCSDGIFRPGPEPNQYFRDDNLAPCLQQFLKLLKEYADAYYSNKHRPESNYEDLYYLAQQIEDEELGEIFNPAIRPFVEEIKNKTVALCSREQFGIKDLTFRELGWKACIFIEYALWQLLGTNNNPEGMNLIKELALSPEVEALDILTLNHDILVERFLSRNGIQYADGFGLPDGDVRFFKPSTYDEDIKVRLFKLHGSINWFWLRRREGDIAIAEYGIPINNDIWHFKDAKGENIDNLMGGPRILIGTYNKIPDYGQGIFSGVHLKFQSILPERDLMVMSGYGWNDRGISLRLREWLNSSMDKRLYLLHQNPESEIRDKSKSGMWHWYEPWVKEGRLVPIKQWLCDIKLPELIGIIKTHRSVH
ncbi:MAG: SIR2 family protein [Candidatus Aureabacteria bacterium]|nr:SIR2 family protein [Candidatus Auribacterota bacterium]